MRSCFISNQHRSTLRMTDPAVFPASYVRLQTMADGTLRLTLDVEPLNSQKAFALCSEPGVTFALARLTDEAAKQQMQDDFKKQADEPSDNTVQLKPAKKPMLLSVECALWCKAPEFWGWLNEHFSVRYDYGDEGIIRNEDKAVAFIKSHLEIASRAELDSEGAKRDSYIKHIQTPYRAWVNK